MEQETPSVNKAGFINFKGRKDFNVLLGFVFILGAVLRFIGLGAQSYWIDEMYTVVEGQQTISQLMTSGRLDQPIGYYLPFHYWIEIFGTSEAGTRSFSALAGIGSIILIYLVGRNIFGKEIGLLSAFLMSISNFQLAYSQETRYYMFFQFLTLLSFYFFILLLRKSTLINFIAYGIFTILMVYSFYLGVFIVAVQNLVILLLIKKYRKIIVPWLICQALVVAGVCVYYVPIIFGANGIFGSVSSNIGNVPLPSITDPLRTVYLYLLPFRFDRSWTSVLITYAIGGAVFVVAMLVYSLRQAKGWINDEIKKLITDLRGIPDLNSKLILVGSWFIFPILLLYLLSILVVPVYRDRYTISAVPAFSLLLSFFLYKIRRLIPLIISIGVLVIVTVPGLYKFYASDTKEQWAEAAEYVKENAQQSDLVIFAPNMDNDIQERLFDWYYPDPFEGCGIDFRYKDPESISRVFKLCTTGHDRFWVIIPDYEPGAPYRSFFLGPDQTSLRLIKNYPLVDLSVYLFEEKK